jgi:hypothetical protein
MFRDAETVSGMETPAVMYKAFQVVPTSKGLLKSAVEACMPVLRRRYYTFDVTYSVEGDVVLCANGFHACAVAVDCFNPSYGYTYNGSDVLARVQLLGDAVTDGIKTAARSFRLLQVLSKDEQHAACTGCVQRADGTREWYVQGKMCIHGAKVRQEGAGRAPSSP